MTNFKYILHIAWISVILVSCAKDDAFDVVKIEKDVEIIEGSTLKFKNQAIFDKYVNEGTPVEHFYSLLNNFEDAMKEAESYYDREGGYEEFKAKYSGLYFPEYGDDYSAFLPVSNEKVAKFLDINGNVIISDEVVNMKDINSPEQLIAIGLLLDKDKVTLRKIENGIWGYPSNGLDEIRYNDRKLWVNVSSDILSVTIHVCYRKKGALGIGWYNYVSTTVLYPMGTPNLVGSLPPWVENGCSSHDYGWWRAGPRIPFDAIFAVTFQGFGTAHSNDKFYFEVHK